MKKLLTLIGILLLVACSESGNNSTGTTQLPIDNSPDSPDSPDSPSAVILAKMELDSSVSLVRNGSVQVEVQVIDLENDDAIYLHVESTEIENGNLLVEPKDSMIYPTDKKAKIFLLFKDNQVVNNAAISVKLVTANGQIVVNSLELRVSE
jgi:hypothetical protein